MERTEFEQEIMDAMKHGRAMHSYAISRAIEERRAVQYPHWWQFGRRMVLLSTLFTAIHKLMRDGLIAESPCDAGGSAYQARL